MLKIRKAACSDGAAIERINKEALGYEFSETAASLKSILQNPDYILFAAELDGRVIGYIHGADYSTTYSRPLKNILTLAVLPDVQGEGVGRALLSALEDWAKAEGAAGVRLVSGANRTKAHGFYIHMGYFMRKEQKNFMKLF